MKITGHIRNESNEPIRDARVELFRINEPKDPIDVVPSGEDGEFELSPGHHEGQPLRIVVTRNGRVIVKEDIPSGRGTGLVLIAVESGAKITGYIKNESNEPVRDANVELFLISEPKDPIDVVPSGQDGEFELSPDQHAGEPLKIVVTKQGFVTREQDIPSGKGTGLVVTIGPPPGFDLWKKIILWWEKSNWPVRALAGGGAIVLLVFAWKLIFGPKPDTIGNGTTGPEVQVHLNIRSMNTNATLIFTNRGAVFKVTVRLNDEKEGKLQTFKNKDFESNPVVIDVPLSHKRVLSATVKINDQNPQERVFMTRSEALARDAADHVYDAVNAMGRIGASVAALNGSDEKLKEYARRFIPQHKKKYLNHLQSMADMEFKPERLKEVIDQFTPNGPYSKDELDVQDVMLPVLKAHFKSFLSTGQPPRDYTDDIFKAYQKVKDSITKLLQKESQRK